MYVLLTSLIVLLAVGVVNARDHKWLDDPGQLGHYAIGHTGYFLTDKDNGNRPVYIGVWYPVDAKNINYSTPLAQYPLDPYTGINNLPVTLSTDWEPYGYDRAYEGPTPSEDGPFPLVVFSPGKSEQTWQLIYLGTRLASHGYVVAVTEHWADCQWSWSACDDFLTAMVNRPRDMSFAITQLLAKKTGRAVNCCLAPSTETKLPPVDIRSVYTPRMLSQVATISSVTHCGRLFLVQNPYPIPLARVCRHHPITALGR